MISAPPLDTRIERRINYTQSLLAVLLVVVIVTPFLLTWLFTRNAEVVHEATLSNIEIVGPSALCPGETLRLRYEFAARGSGVLVVDSTLWRMTPPMTVVFSEARRFIMEDDFSRTVNWTYTIPATIIDEATGQPVPLPPGQYKRIVAVSSPSRSGVFSKQSVQFLVREDCN